MTLFTPPQILDGPRWRNMRVGLLGGSFNPPHPGHLHISEIALKRLRLDCIWWLVTPQNPLKKQYQTSRFDLRFYQCQTLTARNPRIIVSDLEQRFGSVRTIETIINLKAMFPATQFVLLAGADILPQFHRWYCWRDIPLQMAMAFIGRPPAVELTRANALTLAGQNRWLVPRGKAVLSPGHLYRILDEPLNPLSSTEIRKTL